jgi:N-carbamoylputrescine amidase
MKKIKAASVQFNHHAGDKKYNLSRIHYFTKSASEEKVDLIVFPEMCVSGYWHVRNLSKKEIELLAEPVPAGPTSTELLSLSAEHNIIIGAGFIERSNDGKLYNSYVVAMPDGSIATHRKLHCFISEHMEDGDDYTVFEIPGGIKVGILICYDNNIVENARITALKGAEILLAPHQTGGCDTMSPRAMGKIDLKLWEDRDKDPKAIEAEFKGSKGRGWLKRWLPSRAHDNGMFLIFSNGVGADDDEVRTGNAMIIDPYGETIVETWRAKDEMVIADLDLELIPMSTGRRWIKSRRPNLYGPLTVPVGIEKSTRDIRFGLESGESGINQT